MWNLEIREGLHRLYDPRYIEWDRIDNQRLFVSFYVYSKTYLKNGEELTVADIEQEHPELELPDLSEMSCEQVQEFINKFEDPTYEINLKLFEVTDKKFLF